MQTIRLDPVHVLAVGPSAAQNGNYVLTGVTVDSQQVHIVICAESLELLADDIKSKMKQYGVNRPGASVSTS